MSSLRMGRLDRVRMLIGPVLALSGERRRGLPTGCHRGPDPQGDLSYNGVLKRRQDLVLLRTGRAGCPRYGRSAATLKCTGQDGILRTIVNRLCWIEQTVRSPIGNRAQAESVPYKTEGS